MITLLSLLGFVLATMTVFAQETAAPWTPFTSTAGAFTVMLPGTPTEQKQSVNTAAGLVEVVLFVCERRQEQATYVVSFSELPAAAVKPGSEAKRLDNARDGAVASTKGTLRREQRIALQHSLGRDIEIEIAGKRRIRTRMYAVRNRLYQILAVGPGNLIDAQETTRFLDSFRLTK